MRPRAAFRLLAWLSVSPTACGTDTSTGSSSEATFAARDSAGVRVVESAAPRLQGDLRWTIDDAPFLSIGEVDGETAYLLNNVVSAEVLPDGRVLVANQGDASLRFYAPDGTFLSSFGRRGEGPGEFRGVIGSVHVRGSEILVYSTRPGPPVQIFDLDGRPLRTLSHQGIPPLSPLQIRGLLADGSAVVVWIPQAGPAEGPVGGVRQREAPVFRFSADGSRADSVASFPMVRHVNVGAPTATPQAFGYYGFSAVGGDRVYLGWNASHEIRVVDGGGRLVRVLRWRGMQLPITRARLDAWRAQMRAPVSPTGQPLTEEVRQRRIQTAEAMVFPTHHWAFARLLLDEAGHLWAQRYYEPTASGPPAEREASAEALVWDVFDPDGVWVDTVETPPALVVSSIAAGHVAGVSRDALGVERVRLHRLRRTGGG